MFGEYLRNIYKRKSTKREREELYGTLLGSILTNMRASNQQSKVRRV